MIMLEKKQLESLQEKLVTMAERVYQGPWEIGKFSKNERANQIINNIQEMPHVFVMACLLGRQFHDEKAWETMAYLEERIGTLDIKKLSRLTQSDWEKAFMKPTPLHGFPREMAGFVLTAVQRIVKEYDGDAGRIWNDKPSSATVIKRFLEFEGIGPKISTMATNILVRYFKIQMSDCYSVEVTVDGRMKRVLSRMGIVDSKKPKYIQLTVREMYPKYPGIFDPVFWEIGKFHCFPVKPDCASCPANELCQYSQSHQKKQGVFIK
jgi:endonuclease III